MSTSLPSLSARMATIKESSNTSPRSNESGTTPLATFLHIYNKAYAECNIPYMGGAKELYSYLSPIEIPNTSGMPYVQLPQIVTSYDLTELAKILTEWKGATQSGLSGLRRMEQIIILVSLRLL